VTELEPPNDSQGNRADRDIGPTVEPPNDSLVDTVTLIVHLPQPLDKMAGLYRAIGELWPTATAASFARIEIPADE